MDRECYYEASVKSPPETVDLTGDYAAELSTYLEDLDNGKQVG